MLENNDLLDNDLEEDEFEPNPYSNRSYYLHHKEEIEAFHRFIFNGNPFNSRM